MTGGDRTYRVAARLFAILFRLLGLRITVRGAEHLPTSGPAVLASNHTGFLDFTFVGYAARERGRLVRFMSKVSVFDSRITGPLMRAMRHIPVDRWTGASAYRQARRALDAGELVGVFPEATISRSFLVKPLKPGAAGLAISRSVPLVPVAVWGSHRIATVDGRRGLRRGKALTILVGEPLHPADGESIAELTERLHAAMTALVDEAIDTYPDTPKDDADRWWLPHDRGGTAPPPEVAAALDRAALERINQPVD
ncbi:lysophospholipid acyltransferase family protein [Aeromicrobium terrae]|uniref:1-acyl-sn-glycerol-3-phosphate acyltransferase n=1 Tax=Aeromicrobium terrae TaxID=2498846 RepID=A0A5C8NNE3_9ACTN|nr:lysophospholipid acyltransferase family protein [Aeromicrobium terrae]TXL62311.1 1-acyl-sn-glycerol-3-phosphate acyltransferase [Aeromicrobium terrae]